MASLKKILPTVILPTARHSASIIFAHGFGATAADWVVLASLPQLRPHCKFIFPQAPLRAITIAGGPLATRMPAWFDILQQDHTKRTQDGDEDQVGMEESLAEIERLVHAEVESGIKSERVVVGGFSQGAALALLEGVAGKAEIGGVVVLSGYLPLQWKIEKMKNARADALPVFWSHGTADSVIRFETGRNAAQRMVDSGMAKIEFRSYAGMDHSYCEEEIRDLNNWLLQRLPPLDPKM